jgi:uncharacterized membrane protein
VSLPSDKYVRSSTEFDRGIQFFDAIYGFAITLQITTVHLPPSAAWSSEGALLRSALPSELIGFVLSFVVIAVFWRENYLLMSSLKALDGVTIASNIVCAFFIVLITFTTQALHAPSNAEMPLPVALYALNIALAAAAQVVMVVLAQRRGLTITTERATAHSRLNLVRRALVPGVFLLSIPVAYVFGARAAQISWASLLVLAPLLLLARRRGARAELKWTVGEHPRPRRSS